MIYVGINFDFIVFKNHDNNTIYIIENDNLL